MVKITPSLTWGPKYYVDYYIGYRVMERTGLMSEFFPKIHSWHDTKDEAEAVALALNELTG